MECRLLDLTGSVPRSRAKEGIVYSLVTRLSVGQSGRNRSGLLVEQKGGAF
jgi:hypothetical protein